MQGTVRMSFVIIHFSSIGTSSQGPSVAAPPSLEYLTKDIPPEKLDQPCSDKHLSEIAHSVTGLQSISSFLGLTGFEEEEITYRHRDDLRKRNEEMLRRWKSKCAETATYMSLATILWSQGKVDSAHKVCTLSLADGDVSTSAGRANAVCSLKEFLRHVPPDKLNQPCRIGHLKKIALSIAHDWQPIALLLGLTEIDVESIKKDCGSLLFQTVALLRRWKNKHGK